MLFRTVAVASPETELPGTTRPAGFTAVAARPGGPVAFAWWVVFYDGAGLPLAGGSATVQWYGVDFDGTSLTTPTIGGAAEVDALDTATVTAGAGVWLWCRVLAMTGPGTSVTARVFVAETVAGADAAIGAESIAAIAAAVAGALSIPTAAEIAAEVDAEGGAAAAIAAAALPSAADVATAVGAQAACEAAIDAKLADIGAAVALAVPDAADVQAAAAAGYGDAWGTVLEVKAQYFNATPGNLTGVFIAPPGAGLRLEILYWGVTTFATAGSFSWSSGATLNLDTGPDVQMRFLGKGAQVSEPCISPEHPLYTLAENANFGITLDVDAEIVVDIKYRIVATS